MPRPNPAAAVAPRDGAAPAAVAPAPGKDLDPATVRQLEETRDRSRDRIRAAEAARGPVRAGDLMRSWLYPRFPRLEAEVRRRRGG